MSITPIENPTYDVCAWPVDPACLTDEWTALSDDVQRRSLALASATLRRLTGYRVGGCPATIRPCTKKCAEGYGQFFGSTFQPFINMDGNWVNSCGCTSGCSCGPLCSVKLPPPIGAIIEVTVGALDITADTKVIGNELVWTGQGECPFLSCQDLSVAVGEEGAFAVTYLNSYPVDGLGAYAAGILAMEYAKACSGSKCRLPKGTTSVSRQGISIEVVSGSFPEGVTGIQEVDAYIALWRPAGSPQWPMRVWAPGRASQVER